MLRIHQCKSAKAAQSYYTQGLAREDYYTGDQEIPGRWRGRGAELLELGREPEHRAVDRDTFFALTENRHPVTGDRLTLRTKLERTVGYDMNFHAPKGVSLLHALHKDERILDTFRESVDSTMRTIEADACARIRRGGAHADRPTGNLVWSEFVHLTARPTKGMAPDPHLHAHCFVFNATFDEQEQVWKAGQFRPLVRDAPYYEAYFHARFAESLSKLGYAVERTATGWDLAELPRSLVEKYSLRTKEIEAIAAERGVKDPDVKAKLGALTRQPKDKDAAIVDLTVEWDKRLTSSERELLADVAKRGESLVPADAEEGGFQINPPDAARAAVDQAIRHCFERLSSIPQRRLAAEALRRGVGGASPEAILDEIQSRDWIARDVNGQRVVTTQEVLREEKAMMAFAVDGKGTCEPFAKSIARRMGEEWKIQDERLAPDQRGAVEHLLNSQDRVMAVRGAAGVGKTTMMREAISAIRAAGHSVVVVAPSASAARGDDSLRRKGFPSADTVAALLKNARMQQGLTNSANGGVLWVDEAGLLGVGSMRQLFDLAKKHNARVVLSGDARQHKPVERGDAMRVLERLGGVTPAEIKTIRRQRGLYREAVVALADGEGDRAVTLLKDLGAFHEIEDSDERERAAAADYVETIESGRTAFVISPTHAEGERVSTEIRSQLRNKGRLKGEDRTFSRLRDLGWTEAERSDAAYYSEGLVAHFHQHAKGVVAGDKCVIVGIQRNDQGDRVVRARTPRGVEINLPLEHADRFQVYRKDSIDIAVGDLVRVTKNGRTVDDRGRLVNGAVHRVLGFTKHGAIILDRGNGVRRIVPREYGHIAHGCVMTSHASQGKDVDKAILVQSADSYGASSGEQLYVSVSRGKHGIAIYTDSTDQLSEAVKRTAERQSAIELASSPLIELQAQAQDSQRRAIESLMQETARRQSQQRHDKLTSFDEPPDPTSHRLRPGHGENHRKGREGPERERDIER